MQIGRPLYQGMSTLTAANWAFLAERCRAYREENGLNRKQAARLCDVCYRVWWAIEDNSYDAIGFSHDNSVVARIVNLVLRVSPVCRKGESQHIQPATGASHGTKEEDRSEADDRKRAAAH